MRFAVGLEPLVLGVHHRAGVHHPPLRDERQDRDPRLFLPVARGERDDAALVGRPHLGPDVDPQALEEGRERPELLRVVVVAGDQDAGDALGHEARQEVVDELLGLGRGRRRVEDVARDEDGIHLAVDGDPGHLTEGPGVLVHPRAAPQRLADVPVGGVEEAHGAQSIRAPVPGRVRLRRSDRTKGPWKTSSLPMATPHAELPPPRKPLRLWPGVVAVALQWLAGFLLAEGVSRRRDVRGFSARPLCRPRRRRLVALLQPGALARARGRARPDAGRGARDEALRPPVDRERAGWGCCCTSTPSRS